MSGNHYRNGGVGTIDHLTAEASKTYDDFVRDWGDRIKSLVASKQCFDDVEVDDITQDLLFEFFQKDYLMVYDPTLENASKFSTFVFNFVNKRLLGKRDKVNRRRHVEGLSMNAVVSNSEGDEVELGELFQAPADWITLEFKDTVHVIYDELKQIPNTSTVKDLSRLFLLIVKQVMYGCNGQTSGRHGIDRKLLAKEMGVSESGISIMIKNLREQSSLELLLAD